MAPSPTSTFEARSKNHMKWWKLFGIQSCGMGIVLCEFDYMLLHIPRHVAAVGCFRHSPRNLGRNFIVAEDEGGYSHGIGIGMRVN